MHNIILASKSRVRRDILEKNGIDCIVENSNIDEDSIKESLIKEGASPELISKNLAELKANKVSEKKQEGLVLGAGVAGLQAIATSRRLGAVLKAFDVRPVVKEQVESLGYLWML